MKTNLYKRTSVPSAFITKGKQRLKQYDDVVYLNNGEEFQIELFNPTKEKILAKILINGKFISNSGIVLRPGERVFLERYLDEPRKFKFDTYTIDENDMDAMDAIENNGMVEVQFFEEYKIVYYNYNTTYPEYPQQPGITYTDNTGYQSFNSPGNQNVNTTSEVSEANMCCFSLAVETGRVDKGSHSSQDFEHVNAEFNLFHAWKSTWKILPKSRKPIMKEDLKVFCSDCGAKRKKDSHNFCPHCGNRY